FSLLPEARLRSLSCILLVATLGAIVADKAPAADVLPCARFAHEDLPQPYPRGDSHGIDRLEQINQAVKDTPYSALCFGNSFTAGWAPVIWERSLAPRRVLNAGVSGDYTEILLWRLEHGNLAGPTPRVMVPLIGTNDLAAGVRRNSPPTVSAPISTSSADAFQIQRYCFSVYRPAKLRPMLPSPLRSRRSIGSFAIARTASTSSSPRSAMRCSTARAVWKRRCRPIGYISPSAVTRF